LQIEEKKFEIYQDGFGMIGISGVVWDCGLYLADFLCSTNFNSEILGSSFSALENVLDIGCGTGIGGLCALFLGAAHVTFNDQIICESLESNIDQFGQSSKVEFVKWKWSTEEDLPISLANIPSWDLVLCSDVLYDNKSLGSLNSVIQRLRFNKLVIAYKKRHGEYEREFFEELSNGYDIQIVPPQFISPINLPSNLVDGLYIIVITSR
jgi:hypothetical protein